MPGPGGVSAPGGACSWGVPGGDPPGRLLLWAVRILLECILVSILFAVSNRYGSSFFRLYIFSIHIGIFRTLKM